MIPQFFTVTLWGGRATTRVNAHLITRISPAAEGAVIYLAGGDPVRVNHSGDEVEAMIAETFTPSAEPGIASDSGFVTPEQIKAQINPRAARKKAA